MARSHLDGALYFGAHENGALGLEGAMPNSLKWGKNLWYEQNYAVA
ncbi:hypothetical protein G3580_15300 [Nitrogeniibacter mangrovi]|uniref:Uncharacterized protein n=1 Tax=Nitrogeniibacter mangrovi TaxID=2016596 RepID=A0A6C1B7D8_9RHOO|nr:hypothetical protein [Nitrogeniibacter mangrovi]QID18869.1 hypothetical protein G3580_15300 [Nitrogeniibacter mangrovi]